MTNDEFKWLIVKSLRDNHLIQVMVTDNRCAANRVPSAFSKTIDEIIQVLAKNLSSFCDPSTQYVRVFNLQPVVMQPPNSAANCNDFWCSLEMDVCRRNDNSIVRTTAMHINFSNGHIVNEAEFLCLFGIHSINGASPAILGKISPELIFVAWSELRRKIYTQELNPNDKNVAEVYNNPLCFQSSYRNLSELPSIYYLSIFRLSMIRTASVLSGAQQAQLTAKTSHNILTHNKPC